MMTGKRYFDINKLIFVRAGIPPSLLRRNLHSSLSNILAYEEAAPANSMQTSLNNTHRNRKEFGSPRREYPAGRRSGQSTERYSQPVGPKSGYIRSKWEKIGYENNQEMSSITKASPERRRYLEQETLETEEQQRDSLEDLEEGYFKRQKKRRNSQEKYGSPIKKKVEQERIMTKDKQAASFQGRIKKAGELMKASRTYGEIHKGRRPSGPVSPTKPAKNSKENSKRSKGSKSISQRSEEGGFSHRLLTKEMLKSSKIELTDETELSDTVENFVVGYEPKRKPKPENPSALSRKASRGVIEERAVTKIGQEISTKSTQRDDIDSLNSRIDRIKREIIEDITRKTQESISSHSSDMVKSRSEIADSEPSCGLRRDSLEENKQNFKGNSPIQELSKRYGEQTGVPRPRPEPKISGTSKEMEAVKTSPVAWFAVEDQEGQEGQERKRTSAWNDDSRRGFEPVNMGNNTEESEFPGLIEDSRWPTNYSMGINGNEVRLLEQNVEFSFEKSQQKNEKSLDYSKESQEEIPVNNEIQGKIVKQQAPNFSQIESLFKANPVQPQQQNSSNISYDSKAYSSPTKTRPFMGFIKAPPKYTAQQGSPSKSIDYFFRAYNQQSTEPLKEVSIPYSFGGIQPQPVVVDKSFTREMMKESQEYGSRKINHYEVKVIYNDDKKDLMLMNFLNGNLLTSQLQESPNKKMRRRVF